MTVSAAAALRGHDLRRDVGAGRAHRRGQPRARVSPTRTARPRCSKAAENAIADGVNQYPPGPRASRRCGEAIAAQRQPPLRHRLRPGHRGAGHRRRHRGHRRGDPRPRRTGLRGGADRAVLRLLLARRSRWPAVSACRAAGARRPRLRASTSTALRSAVTPRTKALIVNSPHNPTGMVLADDELTAHRRDRRGRTTCWSSPTRSTSTWCSTATVTCRWPTTRAWPSAPSRSPVRPRCSTAPAGRSDGLAAQPISSPACVRPSST